MGEECYSEDTAIPFYFIKGSPDYSLYDAKLAMLKSVGAVANNAFFIKDLHSNSYPYISYIPLYLTGYAVDELYAFGDRLFDVLLLPEDRLFMQAVELKAYSFINQCEKEQRGSFVITVSYNLVHKDGNLVPINMLITPFLFDDNDKVWMVVGRMIYGKNKKKFSQFLFLDIYGSDSRFVYNNETDGFDCVKRPMLTYMEKSVLVFSIRGYLEKEIADDFSISVNTVKSHKRSLLKKLDAVNVLEAYIMATVHKII